MKHSAIAFILTVSISFFLCCCNSEVPDNSKSGQSSNASSSSSSKPSVNEDETIKIKLSASDIKTVKGIGIKDGKFTVQADVYSISGSDIVFSSEKISSGLPDVRFGEGGATTDCQLKSGDNTIIVFIKGNSRFSETKFTINILFKSSSSSNSPAVPSNPDSPSNIILTAGNIQTIFGKQAAGNNIFMIGDEHVMSQKDIVFTPSALKGKTPVLVLKYIDKNGQNWSSETTGKLLLKTFKNTGAVLNIEVKAFNGFASTKFNVTLKRNSSVKPNISGNSEGEVSAANIKTIFGASSVNGDFLIGTRTSMKISDIVFNPIDGKGQPEISDIWYFGIGGQVILTEWSVSKLLKLPSNENNIILYIKIKNNTNFKETTFEVNLKR